MLREVRGSIAPVPNGGSPPGPRHAGRGGHRAPPVLAEVLRQRTAENAIFTDGAEEDGVVGVGGMLLDESVTGNEFFGGVPGRCRRGPVNEQVERHKGYHLRRQRGQGVLDQGHQRIQGLREVGHRLLVQGSRRGAVHLDWESGLGVQPRRCTIQTCLPGHAVVRDHLKKSGDDVGRFFWTAPCEVRRREAVTSTPLGTKQQQ